MDTDVCSVLGYSDGNNSEFRSSNFEVDEELATTMVCIDGTMEGE